ncbi:GMC oxidoreductase [Stipitochalara longipes BDJ]|nr:GMC oxidoreductase [Stipitochalara longipes BDJ]
MAALYDFVVVGAGASGSVVASRLAHTASRPSVLLLESGGPNDSLDNLSGEDRFGLAFSAGSPLNWGYKTQPQNHLDGQEIDYSRGKGLGGSTAINFCGWVVGPRDDYDEWAKLVEDESFGWANAKACLRKIENLHPEIPNSKLQKYVDVKVEDHGNEGKLHLTYGSSWVSNVGDIFVAAEQSGFGTNTDTNSGDPIGMGMGSVCIYKGQRLTASSAYLSSPPPNITILPHASVAKILIKGKIATGVELVSSRRFLARKEVIVCGGALNSPQILMLSGVGPREELQKHGIPLIHELQMVGKNLQDHCFSSVGIVMKLDENSPESADQQSPTPMGWFKIPTVLSSKEHENLPKRLKSFLDMPTVPTVEIATHTPPSFLSHTVSPNTSFLGAICLVFNPQSRGTVLLQSSNPTAAPLIDPNFLTHEYDKRVIIEGMREMMRLLSAPVYASKTIQTLFPNDDSDETIWEYVRHNTFSSWHMSGTVCMGVNSASACVDSNFRVFGLESLRVVDLSVCPFVPNNHTQSTAYVVGELAAEKLIKEYDLKKKKNTLVSRF